MNGNNTQRRFFKMILTALLFALPGIASAARAAEYPTLTPAKHPEDVGFSSKKLDALDKAIR